MVGLAYVSLGPEMSGQLLEVLTIANALESLIADTLVCGRTEGMRDLVRGAIERRFGPPPTALDRRIAAADERALSGMLDRLAVASRSEELLDD